MLGAVRPPGDHDLFHHHRRAPLAGGRNVQDGKGRARLGPVPGPELERHLPAHRPGRPRPAPRRRHPRRAHRQHHLARRRPAPATATHGSDRGISDADLQIPLGDAPVPARGGQPCPPGIAPIRLSIAETVRLTGLARQYAAGLITRARLAFALRWSLRRRRHQAAARWHHYSARLLASQDRVTSDGRKEVTPCNRTSETGVTLSGSAATRRKTATVILITKTSSGIVRNLNGVKFNACSTIPSRFAHFDAYGPNLRNIFQSIILLMAVALLIFGFKAQSIFSAVLIGLSIILGGWSGVSIARNIYRAEKLRRRYRRQLEASMDAYDAALVERGVLPQIRILLNDLQEEHYYSSRFTVKSAPGLQSDDSRFQVETTGSKNFTRLLGAMADRGGSVGIAGPRGSGKTSLLQAICAGRLPIGAARRRNSPDLFSVLVAAPVEFSSREFLLHFFAKLCEHLISWDTGLRSLASQPSPPKSKGRPKVPVGLIGVLCVIASIVLLLLALPSAQRQQFFRTKVTPALAKLFGHNWNSVKQFVGGMNLRTTLIGIGLLLVGLILCILVIVRMLRTQSARYLKNNRPALIKYARDRLQRIRFQLSYSSGWSGTLKLPVVEGGVNEMLSAAENQMSLPDVVAEIKAFLTEITLAVRNIRLVLAIDELDKLESDVKAWQFLNDLKGIFGVPRCLYLVSISEEALSSFELRGFPFRDAFDSAFDEVAHLRQLTYGESRALLRRRVIGLSGPYICLCHCMAGGLPRDLIRVARDLVILRREGRRDSRDLSDITADLIQEDLRVRSAATMIAVSRKSAGLQIGELAAWIDRVQNTRVMTADEILNVCRSYPGVVGPSLSKTETGDGNAQMTETFLEIHQLGFRLCGLLYFSATLIELLQDDLTVTQIDWLEGIGPKSVDRLALARQAFAS